MPAVVQALSSFSSSDLAALQRAIGVVNTVIGGYSDVLYLPRHTFADFQRLCAAMAAAGVWVEIAQPTVTVRHVHTGRPTLYSGVPRRVCEVLSDLRHRPFSRAAWWMTACTPREHTTGPRLTSRCCMPRCCPSTVHAYGTQIDRTSPDFVGTTLLPLTTYVQSAVVAVTAERRLLHGARFMARS